MPLKKSSSKSALSYNIKKSKEEGKPIKQAIAIAKSIQCKSIIKGY